MNFLKAFSSSLLLALVPVVLVISMVSFAIGEMFLPQQVPTIVLVCFLIVMSFFRALALVLED